jgi:DNA polymerase III sliding clamp (beta) subunit (PCNA family)
VAEEVLAALDETPARDVTVTVDGAEAAAAVRRVAGVAAQDASPLGGVLLDVADDGLSVVATDRYRMASWRLPVAESRPGEARGFVPLGELGTLAEALAPSATASVTVAADRLTVEGDSGATTLDLGPDRFPAYRLVLPPTPTGRTTLPLGELRDAVALVADGPVRVAATRDGADVGGYGDAPRTRLAGVTVGDPRVLWLARDLLAGSLDACVGDAVTVAWSEPDRPVRLSPVEQRRLDVLLMPVHPPV